MEVMTGGPIPGTATYIAGSDGTAARALKVGADGSLGSSTASAIVTQLAGVSVTTSTTAVLASVATRKGCQIVNTGTAGVTLTLGATAVAKQGIWLAANGGAWDGMIGPCLWTGIVNAISDSGTNVVTVVAV